MMDIQFYKCKSCGWYVPAQTGCVLRQEIVNPEEDFCSKHKFGLPESCDLCGNVVPQNILMKFDEEQENYNIICGNCLQALDTCQVCSHFNECEFETNPDPLPKMVRQELRDGNMYVVTDVKNPERIRKFCQSCKCYGGEENGCLKQFNLKCGNHHINIVTKNSENVNE